MFGTSIATETEEFGPTLVLTEPLLRDILMSDGFPRANAIALARRVCMSLPDLPTLISRVETSVMDRIMAELEREVTDEVMKKLRDCSKDRSDRTFGKIDTELCDRIDEQAVALMEEDADQARRSSRQFELSILRANCQQSGAAKGDVLVLTSEMRTIRSRNA